MSSNRHAIEEYFLILEINRLAEPEGNAFKPIYQMHKWFARLASCVFRGVLLTCLKPAGTDIMQELWPLDSLSLLPLSSPPLIS